MAHDLGSDEEHVRTLDDQERLAALERDVPALDRLWSEEFVVNAPNNQVVVGRRAVLDTFVGLGVTNFSRFDRQIEFVRAVMDPSSSSWAWRPFSQSATRPAPVQWPVKPSNAASRTSGEMNRARGGSRWASKERIPGRPTQRP